MNETLLTLSMDSVTSLWEDSVDIADWGERDFESRAHTITIYDSDGTYQRAVQPLTSAFGLDRDKTVDYCMRVFLASMLDGFDETDDVRVDSEIVVTLPPRGWLDDANPSLPVDGSSFDNVVLDEQRETVRGSTTRSVLDVARMLVDNDMFDSISEVGKWAITFVVDGYARRDTLLHERG